MAPSHVPARQSLPARVVRWHPGRRSSGVAATRVRCRLPARLLRQAGIDSRLTHRREDPTTAPCDVLVVQDPRAEEDVDAARRAATRGIRVIVDLSDPALATTDAARRTVDSATTVTVRHIGLSALIDHPDVLAVDDAVEWTHPSPPIRPRPAPGEPARLTWFGVGRGPSEGTGIDELQSLGPTLTSLARRRRIELLVVTDDRARADALLHDRAIPGRSIDWSPWRLRSVLAATHLCVLPVGTGPAIEVRSAHRPITSLVQGVMVVAGHVPAYETLGRGVVFGAWETNIDRFLADQDAVERCVGAGRDAIRSRFADGEILSQWRRAIGRRPETTRPADALASQH